MEHARTLTKAFANIGLGLRIVFMGNQWSLFHRINGSYEHVFSSEDRTEVVTVYNAKLRELQK